MLSKSLKMVICHSKMPTVTRKTVMVISIQLGKYLSADGSCQLKAITETFSRLGINVGMPSNSAPSGNCTSKTATRSARAPRPEREQLRLVIVIEEAQVRRGLRVAGPDLRPGSGGG